MTKKRIVSALLAVCMVLTMLPLTGLTASAVTYSQYVDPAYWSYEPLDGGTAKIVGCEASNITSLTVPSTLSGRTVTQLGREVFKEDCYALESLTIPDTVTYIDSDAFSGASSLRYITIGDGLQYIEDETFSGLYVFSVKIGNGLIGIGDRAFYNCTSLSTISIGTSVEEIGESAFENSRITAIKLPSTLKTIGTRAFARCDSLKTITIPNSVTSIGDSAFSFCEKLKDVVIENGVTEIGNSMFSSCYALESVTLPNSLTGIGDSAFDGCMALENVTIPNGVMKIGENAFQYCGLTEITIPDSVTTIGGQAFLGCYLESAVVGNGITVLSEEVFAYNRNLNNVVLPVTLHAIDNSAFYDCSALENITIPVGVTEIGTKAFCGCTSLKTIAIPTTVTTIEDYAFGYSYSTTYREYEKITDFTIHGHYNSAAETYANDNNFNFISCEEYLVSYNAKGGNSAPQRQIKKAGEPLTLTTEEPKRNGYTFLGWSTDYNASYVQYIAGDTYVADADVTLYAVWRGNAYTIHYNASGGSGYMEDSFHIYGEKSPGLSQNKFSRDGYVFLGWSMLSFPGIIYKENSNITINLIPMDGQTVTVYAVWGKISSDANYIIRIINSTTCDIVQYNGNSSQISIPSEIDGYTVRSIDDSAFADCKNLTNVSLSNGISQVGYGAFSGCTSLESVVLPASVTWIAYDAFEDCPALTTIYGAKNSYAETYATDNDIPFVAFDGSMYMVMPESAAPGETVDIPVYVEGADLGVLRFAVQYDADKLEYVALTEDAFEANSGMTVVNAQTPGTLTVASIAGSVPAGEVFVLQFRVLEDAAGAAKISIEVLESVDGSTLDGIPVTLAGGTWTLPIADTYTVRYDANGGSGAPSAQTKVEGRALTLSSTMPTRTGYTFLGWSSDASAASSTYAPGGTYTANADVTLYAVWQANAYTVVYNANGGNGTMSNSTHTYDVGKALNANRFTRNGYTFLGWSERDDATSPTYTDGQSVRNLATANGATVTLYAVWEKDPVTVTSISVAQQPTKTEYLQNEAFSAAGLTLRVAYSDGTSQTITSGFTVSTPDMATPGEKTVTVTYAGKTTSFTIYVQKPAAVDPDAAHVYAESVTARPGETIQIPLYVENNPGVAYVKFKVAYDSDKLDLISAEDQGIFKGIYTTSQTIDVNPYVLQWMNAGNATGDGCFVMLTFKVLDGAAEGDVSIRVTYDEAYNETLDDVAFTFTNPTVTIRDYTPGDINDDGVVNGKDGIILSQYLAEWGTEINLDAADVNGDGVVNGKDSIILSQYLAAWDVELGK